MSVSLVFGACFVKEARAEGLQGGMRFIPMFLDQGFLGRDVDLDLPDAGIRVRFKNGDITAPGVLTILSEPEEASAVTASSASSTAKVLTESPATFGQKVRLDWTTAAAMDLAVADVTLSDKRCGAKPYTQCAIQETFQGKSRVISPSQACSGSARASVRIGATLRLVETSGYMTQGDASWYAYKKCLCAASPDFPKGTYVKVTKAEEPSKSIVVRINDWGPERDVFPKRVIDLDKVAFAKLASTGAGVIKVTVRPLAADDPEALLAKSAEAGSAVAVVPATGSAVPAVQVQTKPVNVPVSAPVWEY